MPKGQIPWNKGRTKKDSKSIKGGRKSGFVSHFKGQTKYTNDAIKRRSEKGRSVIIEAYKNGKVSPLKKIWQDNPDFLRGKNNYNWKGGMSKIEKSIRTMTTIHSFTIYGNAASEDGNPMPKLKMTGKQHWMPKAQLYVQWKAHVVKAYLNSLHNGDEQKAIENIGHFGKPITLGKKAARMDIEIVWKNDAHGDPENIFGSIADALFYNDKYLAGSFTFSQSTNKKASVRVTISVSEKVLLYNI